jgi:hypothetical protein
MKVTCFFAVAASLPFSSSGFSVLPSLKSTKPVRSISTVQLFAAPETNDEVMSNLTKGSSVASFVTAIALGFSVVTASSCSAAPLPDSTSFSATSSITVSVGKEYTDFSMPTYESALNSAVNTNLSGFGKDASSNTKEEEKETDTISDTRYVIICMNAFSAALLIS